MSMYTMYLSYSMLCCNCYNTLYRSYAFICSEFRDVVFEDAFDNNRCHQDNGAGAGGGRTLRRCEAYDMIEYDIIY